jgi:hypothetical protein
MISSASRVSRRTGGQRKGSTASTMTGSVERTAWKGKCKHRQGERDSTRDAKALIVESCRDAENKMMRRVQCGAQCGV